MNFFLVMFFLICKKLRFYFINQVLIITILKSKTYLFINKSKRIHGIKQNLYDSFRFVSILLYFWSWYIFLIVSSKWFLFFASDVTQWYISTHYFLLWHINHIYLPSRSFIRFIIFWELGAAARNLGLTYHKC